MSTANPNVPDPDRQDRNGLQNYDSAKETFCASEDKHCHIPRMLGLHLSDSSSVLNAGVENSLSTTIADALSSLSATWASTPAIAQHDLVTAESFTPYFLNICGQSELHRFLLRTGNSHPIKERSTGAYALKTFSDAPRIILPENEHIITKRASSNFVASLEAPTPVGPYQRQLNVDLVPDCFFQEEFCLEQWTDFSHQPYKSLSVLQDTLHNWLDVIEKSYCALVRENGLVLMKTLEAYGRLKEYNRVMLVSLKFRNIKDALRRIQTFFIDRRIKIAHWSRRMQRIKKVIHTLEGCAAVQQSKPLILDLLITKDYNAAFTLLGTISGRCKEQSLREVHVAQTVLRSITDIFDGFKVAMESKTQYYIKLLLTEFRLGLPNGDVTSTNTLSATNRILGFSASCPVLPWLPLFFHSLFDRSQKNNISATHPSVSTFLGVWQDGWSTDCLLHSELKKLLATGSTNRFSDANDVIDKMVAVLERCLYRHNSNLHFPCKAVNGLLSCLPWALIHDDQLIPRVINLPSEWYREALSAALVEAQSWEINNIIRLQECPITSPNDMKIRTREAKKETKKTAVFVFPLFNEILTEYLESLPWSANSRVPQTVAHLREIWNDLSFCDILAPDRLRFLICNSQSDVSEDPPTAISVDTYFLLYSRLWGFFFVVLRRLACVFLGLTECTLLREVRELQQGLAGVAAQVKHVRAVNVVSSGIFADNNSSNIKPCKSTHFSSTDEELITRNCCREVHPTASNLSVDCNNTNIEAFHLLNENDLDLFFEEEEARCHSIAMSCNHLYVTAVKNCSNAFRNILHTVETLAKSWLQAWSQFLKKYMLNMAEETKEEQGLTHFKTVKLYDLKAARPQRDANCGISSSDTVRGISSFPSDVLMFGAVLFWTTCNAMAYVRDWEAALKHSLENLLTDASELLRLHTLSTATEILEYLNTTLMDRIMHFFLIAHTTTDQVLPAKELRALPHITSRIEEVQQVSRKFLLILEAAPTCIKLYTDFSRLLGELLGPWLRRLSSETFSKVRLTRLTMFISVLEQETCVPWRLPQRFRSVILSRFIRLSAWDLPGLSPSDISTKNSFITRFWTARLLRLLLEQSDFNEAVRVIDCSDDLIASVQEGRTGEPQDGRDLNTLKMSCVLHDKIPSPRFTALVLGKDKFNSGNDMETGCIRAAVALLYIIMEYVCVAQCQPWLVVCIRDSFNSDVLCFASHLFEHLLTIPGIRQSQRREASSADHVSEAKNSTRSPIEAEQLSGMPTSDLARCVASFFSLIEGVLCADTILQRLYSHSLDEGPTDLPTGLLMDVESIDESKMKTPVHLYSVLFNYYNTALEALVLSMVECYNRVATRWFTEIREKKTTDFDKRFFECITLVPEAGTVWGVLNESNVYDLRCVVQDFAVEILEEIEALGNLLTANETVQVVHVALNHIKKRFIERLLSELGILVTCDDILDTSPQRIVSPELPERIELSGAPGVFGSCNCNNSEYHRLFLPSTCRRQPPISSTLVEFGDKGAACIEGLRSTLKHLQTAKRQPHNDIEAPCGTPGRGNIELDCGLAELQAFDYWILDWLYLSQIMCQKVAELDPPTSCSLQQPQKSSSCDCEQATSAIQSTIVLDITNIVQDIIMVAQKSSSPALMFTADRSRTSASSDDQGKMPRLSPKPFGRHQFLHRITISVIEHHSCTLQDIYGAL